MTQDVTEAADQHPLLASSSFSPQPSFLRRRPNDKRSDRKQHTAQIIHPPIAQSQNVNCECFDRCGFNTQTRWDTPSAHTGCGRGRGGMPGGALRTRTTPSVPGARRASESGSPSSRVEKGGGGTRCMSQRHTCGRRGTLWPHPYYANSETSKFYSREDKKTPLSVHSKFYYQVSLLLT